jgi:hypothetical protein
MEVKTCKDKYVYILSVNMWHTVGQNGQIMVRETQPFPQFVLFLRNAIEINYKMIIK